MHELEPISFCSIEEYLRCREQRVPASEVALDGLYLTLADIRRNPGENEAFKFPVRAKRVDLIPLDFDVVTVDILNKDLQPTEQSHFIMRDGVVKRPKLWIRDTQQTIRELYFKDYEDYMPTGPGETSIADEILLGQLALV